MAVATEVNGPILYKIAIEYVTPSSAPGGVMRGYPPDVVVKSRERRTIGELGDLLYRIRTSTRPGLSSGQLLDHIYAVCGYTGFEKSVDEDFPESQITTKTLPVAIEYRVDGTSKIVPRGNRGKMSFGEEHSMMALVR